MVFERYAVDEKVDVEPLGRPLTLSTSGKVVRNRFLRAPLSEGLATYTPENPKTTGIPTQGHLNLYSRWGHGGYGIVVTGNFAVHHLHLECAGNVVISKETASDEKTDMLRKLATAIKADGALAIAQLTNAGRQTADTINTRPFAPSAVQLKTAMFCNTFAMPVALSLEQVRTEVIERFVYAAKAARDAGFDGVQLHAAHGYLLAQFLSPTTNKRTDRYGGDVRKRAQIIVDIYEAIRKEIPASTGFVVGIKLNSAEFQEGGLGVDDAVVTASIVDALGIDFIEFSGGTYERWEMFHKKESTKKREAFFIEFVEAIRPHLKNVKVFLTGGFRTALGMTQAVVGGATDGIGIGRPSTAEPDLPRKILSGKVLAAPMSKLEYDFVISWAVSRVQMNQAAAVDWSSTNEDPCFGIMDCSDDRECAPFQVAVQPYLAEIVRKVAEERAPPMMLMQYKPLFVATQ